MKLTGLSVQRDSKEARLVSSFLAGSPRGQGRDLDMGHERRGNKFGVDNLKLGCRWEYQVVMTTRDKVWSSEARVCHQNQSSVGDIRVRAPSVTGVRVQTITWVRVHV